MEPTFAAIDFETADNGRDSACAIGVVRFERGRMVDRKVRLIRPPRQTFRFTRIHGITWEHVANEPAFAKVWNSLAPLVRGIDFFAAHNASFDRSVLRACCVAHRLAVPSVPFLCTVQLARTVWNIFPTKLPDVCRRLGIRLDHHEAGSDALACGTIVTRASVAIRSDAATGGRAIVAGRHHLLSLAPAPHRPPAPRASNRAVSRRRRPS